LLYVAAFQDDAEAAAVVDAEMRERLGESDESSDLEDEDDSTPNAPNKQQQASSEGEDDDTPPLPAAAASKGRKSQQRQSTPDAAGAVAGYSKSKTRRGSVGGKKPEDPLLNYIISEDARSCNVEVIIPMSAPRILMLEVAEQVAAVTLVSHLQGIQAVSFSVKQSASAAMRFTG
jgi:hypothetical protein